MKPLLFLLFLTPLIFSCTSDSSFNEDDLHGRWELASASRAGDRTAMLAGTFFEFSIDGNLRTNLPEVESSTRYSIANNVIKNKNKPEEVYEIKYLDPEQLVLETFLRDVKFRLEFNRKSQFGNE